MTMPSFKSLDLKVVLGIYISYIVIIMVSITVQCMIIITTRPYVNTGSSGQDTVLAGTRYILGLNVSLAASIAQLRLEIVF